METWKTLIDSFSDVEVWVSLIALNLTIVGLSSLAEKRSVIGMEYGSYLLDKYKIHGKIRMFHLLVFVAVVDVISLRMRIKSGRCCCEGKAVM